MNDVCAVRSDDEHVMGAIIAYGINSLFSLMVNPSDDNGKSMSSGNLLLEFLERFSALLEDSKYDSLSMSPDSLLVLTLDAAFKVSTDLNNNELTMRQLKVIDSTFPFISEYSHKLKYDYQGIEIVRFLDDYRKEKKSK
ncbi:MAG: hypothetical protein HQK54_13565 [Oligoflexales bacterium]|nr:hypothetical protein [Oligoflexales bacterium]